MAVAARSRHRDPHPPLHLSFRYGAGQHPTPPLVRREVPFSPPVLRTINAVWPMACEASEFVFRSLGMRGPHCGKEQRGAGHRRKGLGFAPVRPILRHSPVRNGALCMARKRLSLVSQQQPARGVSRVPAPEFRAVLEAAQLSPM